ncbi:GNAT family N-acetyltransferase [Streptococcus oriscaviae]|uniref:GNAT family N-acetyltransferase n=1 Tax=Streptococcus oriscaviae TaxID=2781599 RepID=A0ABX7YMC8_9STRE|nr:GNAT family N-acetyltransferase [Streptococcus oriscaviae]QUE54985.1 GNAT family N-acetyltransferase [Streptococcus oriscaviae]
MAIRPATKTDIPTLQALLQDILEVHHRLRPDIFKATGQKYSAEELAFLLEDKTKPVFVYEKDGEVLGHLFCKILESKSQVIKPSKTLFIDDLCVAESARGLGIGEAFYQYALELARELGCQTVSLDVWEANKGAVRFYERLGMKVQRLRMEQRVE